MKIEVKVRYKGPDAAGRGGRFVVQWAGKQRTFPYNHALGLEENYSKAVERALGDCSLIENTGSGVSRRWFDAYPRETSQEGIEKMIALSTAHMPSTSPEWGDLRVVKHEYGFVVFVDEGADTPEWARPIMEWALAMEATVVLFDGGAAQVARFQKWSW